MGNYGTDVNGQVLLRLTTTNPDDVRGWLPGGELHQDLMALLHVYPPGVSSEHGTGNGLVSQRRASECM